MRIWSGVQRGCSTGWWLRWLQVAARSRFLLRMNEFEYEFQMAGMNRTINPGIETVFMTPSEQYMFISATIVREIALLGGNVDRFVHPLVAAQLRMKIEL